MATVSSQWKRDMDATVKKWTAWDSFDQMCRSKPALIITASMSDAEKKAVIKMQNAYKRVTGKPATQSSDKYNR